jgi:hypothetical protein
MIQSTKEDLILDTPSHGNYFADLNWNEGFIRFRAKWVPDLMRGNMNDADLDIFHTELTKIVGKEMKEAALDSLMNLAVENFLQHAATLCKNVNKASSSANSDEALKNILKMKSAHTKHLQTTNGVKSTLSKLTDHDITLINKGKTVYFSVKIYVF